MSHPAGGAVAVREGRHHLETRADAGLVPAVSPVAASP